MNTPSRKFRPSAAWPARIALLAAMLATPSAALAGSSPPVRTVPALDVPRYMGTWHEIAKYPNFFQRKCTSETTATYRPLRAGKVEVTNRCRTADGSFIQVVGEARQTGGARSPKLQVRFAPAWLAFLPMVWGNYWIIDLDSGYQLAAVSEPSREYLWILSRTPTVDAAAYAALLARLRGMGFDTAKLDPAPPAN